MSGESGGESAESAEHASLRVGLAELRRRPGNRQQLERSVRVGTPEVGGVSVAEPGDVDVELELESLSDGVTLRGAVRVPWVAACRRCLEPTSGVAEAPISEVVKERPEDPAMLAIEQDHVELGPVVHDAALLALPLAPLCRASCPGPDPEQFPVGTEDEDAAAPPDPRWAALAELDFDAEDDDG